MIFFNTTPSRAVVAASASVGAAPFFPPPSLTTAPRPPFLGYFRPPPLSHHAPVGDRPGSRDKGLDDPVEQDQEREQDHRAEDGESDPARRRPLGAEGDSGGGRGGHRGEGHEEQDP